MSQNWHGHWTEAPYTPKKLRNWEIPNWFPTWPDRHCVTTKFIANDNGHILDDAKKIKHSSWGTYTNTWDMPRRITRSIAQELSATPQYKKDAWELHKKKHQRLCKKVELEKKKKKKTTEKTTDPSKDSTKKDIADNIEESRVEENGKEK